MFAVHGIYDKGQIILNEPAPGNERYELIVTFLDKPKEQPKKELWNSFNELIGCFSEREDGSKKHDEYLAEDIVS